MSSEVQTFESSSLTPRHPSPPAQLGSPVHPTPSASTGIPDLGALPHREDEGPRQQLDRRPPEPCGGEGRCPSLCWFPRPQAASWGLDRESPAALHAAALCPDSALSVWGLPLSLSPLSFLLLAFRPCSGLPEAGAIYFPVCSGYLPAGGKRTLESRLV